MTNIVILDGGIVNPGDLDWGPIQQLGQATIYDRTPREEKFNRAKNAEILVTNKRIVDRVLMEKLKHLKCICLLSTGYDVIDIQAAKDLGITVCNAVGYSGNSVAQHVFSLLLELTNQVGLHNDSVQNGEWTACGDWCYWKQPIMELSSKTMGIYGLGKIGQEVARIALSFGMKVIAYRKNRDKPNPLNIPLVDLPRLFQESDVLSLHAPLSKGNKNIINTSTLSSMKSNAILINTSRGGLVQEDALKHALTNRRIAAAALDVLSKEPPPKNHPLFNLPNCIITPHNAWVSVESRKRLIAIVADNIASFLKGTPINVIV